MAQYLLDSNHASPLVTLHHPLRQRIFTAHQSGHEIGLCIPVLHEVWFGISSVPRAMQNRVEWQQVRQQLIYYGLDEQDAQDAAELRLSLRRKGWQLATMDALIATVALRYQLTLLTNDKDFQAVPQLQIENWLASDSSS